MNIQNAVDANEKLRPVTEEDNRRVNGLAFLGKFGFDETVVKATELRAQEDNYLNSLPTDPAKAFIEIKNLLDDDFGVGLNKVQHCIAIVEEMLIHCDFEEGVFGTQEALAWLAGEGGAELRSAKGRIKRASAIAGQALKKARSSGE